jgi:hypothetical protein
MTADERARLAHRKSLLVSRAELERIQITLQAHELRALVMPQRGPRARGSKPGAIAAALVGIGLPLMGRHRLSRLLRGVSLALTAWRVARNWRDGR